MAATIKTPSYDKAASMLKQGMLQQACTFLSSIRHTLPAAQKISDEAEILAADMNRMLDHFAQGGDDAHREELYDKLYDNAWQLCEHLYDLESLPASNIAENDITTALETLAAAATDDQRLNEAFELIAECRNMKREDRESLSLALLDDTLPLFVRATLLSAVTLYLMERFDAELVESLYIYTFDDQPDQIRMQAWVTLVLVAFVHSDRIDHLPRLKEQYKLICEGETELLFNIQTALLQCHDALTANQHIHSIIDKFEEDDSEAKEMNIKEFIDFVNEGIDLSINVFKKQAKLPFFSQSGTRHHWLEPFSLEQPAMKEVLDANPKALPWVRMMMQSVAQCETEKYATIYTMLGIGEGKLMTAIGEKLEQTGLKFDDIMPVPPLYVMRNYIHDLYRYYSFHPQVRTMRHKPFGYNLLMCKNPHLKDALRDTEMLDKVAERLFRRERWLEAWEVYDCMLLTEESEKSLQRLAYVCHKEARRQQCPSTKALHTLQRCNRLYPGNKWTLKQLADLMHDEMNYVNEENVLKEALTLMADDTALLTRLGRCLNIQHRYKEALEPLYKADLIKEGRRNTQRELAIALFALHDFEHARQYADQLATHSKLQFEDYCACGLIQLQQGDIQQAMELLTQVDKQEAIEELQEKRLLLNETGVDNLKIDLMCELLQRTEHKK